jgi:hypothetical protein
VQGTLILYFFRVRGDFEGNIELPTDENPEVDTEQWWIGPEKTYKIHTYALTKELLIISMTTQSDIEEIAKRTTEEVYSKLLRERLLFDFPDSNDAEQVKRGFIDGGLEPRFSRPQGEFLMWMPSNGDYRTIKTPIDGATPKGPSGFLGKLFAKKQRD